MAKKHIQVAVGIVRQNDLYFLTKRADDVHLGGKWEFPGGKVEVGETSNQALVRELKEEIGISAYDTTLYSTVTHEYEEKIITLDFVLVEKFEGEPGGCEGQLFQWFALNDLAKLDFPAANRTVIDKLLSEQKD